MPTVVRRTGGERISCREYGSATSTWRIWWIPMCQIFFGVDSAGPRSLSFRKTSKSTGKSEALPC